MSYSTLSSSDSRLKVVIAGAGLMGRLLAWRLLLLGHRVTLIEQSDFKRPVSAAHTAAAMVSPMSEVVVSERAIYQMGMASLQLWAEWHQTLAAAGQTVHYTAPGSLVVAHPADTAELQQFGRDLDHHLGSDNNARWLSRGEIHALEPDLANHFEQGLLLPNEAHMDNRGLLEALMNSIVSLGGECIDNTTVTFAPTPAINGNVIQDVDWVLDCRGIGSRESQSTLRGVRGEVLWVQTPEVTFHHPIRLMHPRYKLYIVPKPNNRFIIGATEIESDDRSPVSVQSMLELGSALYTLNPAFAEARILELDANLRPSYWDNLPTIQETPVVGSGPRVASVNGLYRHGFLLAPFLAERIVSDLSNQAPLNFTATALNATQHCIQEL